MTYIRRGKGHTVTPKIVLLSSLMAVCGWATTLICFPVAAQQQSQQQGQPDPRQVELVKKLGLSRNMTGPPAYALGQNGHFSSSAPTNFPIEVYRSNITGTSFMNSTKGAPSASLSIGTKDSLAVVAQFYQTALRNGGWKFQTPSAEAQAKMGQMYMLRAQKDKQNANIMLLNKQGEPGTNISINWYLSP